MNIGDRIKERRLEIDVKVTEIARAAGVSVQAVYAWESGDTKELKGPNLVAVANVLRVTEKWLNTGTLPKEAGGALHVVREPDADTQRRRETVEIPVFDVVASMGLGAAMPEHDTVVDQLRLTRRWVNSNLPGMSSPNSLAVISAYGDSMAPTFSSGDMLIVDRGVSDLRLDAIYVLAFHDELYIKRIQRRRDGSIAIISDNQLYPPQIVPPEEKESVRVLGRVLWAWNGKKL